ncbi:MAG: type II secretion system F family protein [Lentisphaerae bacterium]|nr:type II secretion system F family protein [Lentisphaerota bacterium]
MPQYSYIAVEEKSGREVKGTIEAATEAIAAAELRKEGLFATKIKAAVAGKAKQKKNWKELSFDIQFGPSVIKRKLLMVITRQLATLLEAGLPLIRSLRTLQRQCKDKMAQKVLCGVADSVETGSTFSEALSLYPATFDRLFLNMVRAGEAAGAMETILSRLAGFMEKTARLAGKVKSAMVYPTVVITISLLVTTGLMIFIVPSFAKIFTELLEGEPLPGITQFLIDTSTWMQKRWYILAAIPFIIIFGIKFAYKTKYGKYGLDWVMYYMPILGPIVSKTAIARFSRTLGTLMAAGVPVLNALIIVRDTSGNELVANAVVKVHEAVKEGEGIAKPLAGAHIFPQMVISMIEVGEETGRMPDMLEKVANTYDEEVDNAVNALTSLLEPIMIVVLAVIVGTIVVGLFAPLATIIQKLS